MVRKQILVLIFGVFARTVTTEYCLASTRGKQDEGSSIAAFYNTPHTVTAQCKTVDLTTVLPLSPHFDQRTFWLDKGDYCPGTTCPALVRNTSDMTASTSIHCIDCSELHEMMFDHYGGCEGSDETVTLTAESHEGSCKNDWVQHGHTYFLVSPVRRTMLGSHNWCMSLRNGTTLDNLTELHFIEHVTFPPPIMKYYWISVSIKNHNVAKLGLVLTSDKNEGTHLTTSYNIVQESNLNNLYGSICVRKDKSTTTTTSTTTTKTTTKTIPVTITATTSQTPIPLSLAQPNSNIKSSKYKYKHQINGHMKTSSGTAEFNVRRSVECAIQCDQLALCRSYFFDKVTTVCQLNTDFYYSVSTLVPVATAKYYEKMHH